MSKIHREVAAQFDRIYELLCEDEDGNMAPFRQLIQQVARDLNFTDWTRYCRVTDDFVVVPADGSQHYCDDYEDILASVPESRLELLRSRRVLGPPEHWDKLP